jgi:hypothetical protein
VERGDDALRLDFGRIRGGFTADYAARIVPPQNAPIARSIAQAVGSDRCPKVDVEIEYPSGELRRLSFNGEPNLSSVLTTPNPLTAMVVTNMLGEDGAHLIDVETGTVADVFVSTTVERAASDIAGGRLFLATCIDVVAIGREGALWESRRVSLDGVKMLTYSAGYLRGIGNGPGGQDVSFSIDAATGESTGGFCFAP